MIKCKNCGWTGEEYDTELGGYCPECNKLDDFETVNSPYYVAFQSYFYVKVLAGDEEKAKDIAKKHFANRKEKFIEVCELYDSWDEYTEQRYGHSDGMTDIVLEDENND